MKRLKPLHIKRDVVCDIGLVLSVAAVGFGLWQWWRPAMWLFIGTFWGTICILAGRVKGGE